MNQARSEAAPELSERAAWDALREVPDPEIPVVSVVDLGMIERVTVDPGEAAVRVDLLPTFTGCPALALIRQAIADRLRRLPGVARVEVAVVYDPPWSTERISEEGRRKLAEFGISPPRRCGAAARLADPVAGTGSGGGVSPGGDNGAGRSGGSSRPGAPVGAAEAGEPLRTGGPAICPFCGSRNTRLENAFGPTPCRSIWYCGDCRNPFEQMKVL